MVLIVAGYHLPCSSHANQAMRTHLNYCYVTRRRHAHTPARAPGCWLLLSCKYMHARRETCACAQSVRAQ
eukprot:2839640-Pleurochrysis_carterae.AAC.1